MKDANRTSIFSAAWRRGFEFLRWLAAWETLEPLAVEESRLPAGPEKPVGFFRWLLAGEELPPPPAKEKG